MSDINLNLFQKHVKNFMDVVKTSGDTKIDEQTFAEKVTNDRSIFEMLDFNDDGEISEDEVNTVLQADSDNDGIVTEKELACMQQLKFFAKRDIDKWFTLDINRDGHRSNVETKLGDHRMWGDSSTYTGLDAAMTNEQLAKLYDMEDVIDDTRNETLETWMEGWLEDLKQTAKEQFGIELNDRQIIVLKSEYKKQLNTWLFKTGENATGDAPLYNSLNVTAYTRLITTQQTVSCCGGDIIPPPVTDDKSYCSFLFNKLEFTKEDLKIIHEKVNEFQTKLEAGEITEEEFEKEVKNLYTLTNSSDEVKNRLAWAMYPMSPELKEIKDQIDSEIQTKIDAGELTEREAEEQKKKTSVWKRMSDESYSRHHEHYQQLKDMKASDFRELLKPENEQRRIEFEQNSSMTVQQIVDYIDIVEQQIGTGNFDNDNWSVSAKQYDQIVYQINGTVGDEDKLQGKTRADVPENRQNLLRFLEEKGWLYEQFK